MKTKIPGRYILVFGTFVLSLFLYIDRACISAAKSGISESLSLTDNQMGWVFAMFSLGYALLQTPAGLLADKFGPRKILTSIIAAWSALTAITGAAWNFISLLVIRFLFGAGEAGAFPGTSRAIFSWIPLKERGIVQGINFSGSRVGAAVALPAVAWMISEIGWRLSFIILGLLGIFLAVLWYRLFRDNPEDHKGLSPEERAYILENRQKSDNSGQRSKLSGRRMFSSANMWLAMLQYISSNFIFFFCLSWMFIYLQERFELSSVKTGLFASLPLFAGALGNWVSGIFVDKIYSSGNWPLSRRIPAMIGFLLSAGGIIAIIFANDIYTAVLFLSLAVFGADMTLSPSWSFCIDIGKHHSGAISGTMNMAGNFGALATTIAFPYLRSWTGSDQPFFIISAALCLIAVFAWWFMNPKKSIVD